MGMTTTSQTFTSQDKDNPILDFAEQAIGADLPIIPCKNKVPTGKVKSVNNLRRRPLNKHNFNFYFDDEDAVQIAFLTGGETECIDLDLKYDLTGNLKRRLFQAIEFALPEVWEKLVIEETVSGGFHLLYKCKQIGGNKKLAQRPAIAPELEKGERVKVLIETRGEGGYRVGFPSPGYKQVKGSILELEYITPEQRRELLAICKSFDQIAAPELAGLTSRQKRLPDAPWNVFNQEHDHTWIADTLKNAGWEIVREDDDKVYVLRPGSNAKTSGWIWKESNCLYLFSTSTEFEAEKPYSAFSVYCTLSFDGDVKACARLLAEQGTGTWNAEESEFYTVNQKGKVEIDYAAIVGWLNDIGIRKYWYSTKDFEIVQVLDNIVRIITIDRIKKVFGDYIKDTVPPKVYNAFLASIKSLFTKEGLLSQLEDLDESRFVESSVGVGWLFFKNGALKVSPYNNEFYDYSALEGFVWEKRIIQRDFKAGETEGDIWEFIRLISGQRREIEMMFITAIGYLLHSYKDPVNPKVIILNDEYYDEDGSEPEGGTGKGLFIKLFQWFRNVLSVDGKNFRIDKNFALQGVTPETELFAIEDARRGLDFESFFSIVTEGMTVEKKGKDETKIPYEKSPKILITSNYAIKGSSSSHRRRRYELEVAPYFSNRFTPIDHFKHRFFIDWDAEQWGRFDNYMIYCLQSFLSTGLAQEVSINLNLKRLIQETNRDFITWITAKHQSKEGLPALPVSKEDFKEGFCNVFPDYNGKLTTAKFTQWILRWASDYNVKVDASNSYNGRMCYRFSGNLKAGKAYEDSKCSGLDKSVNGRTYEDLTTPSEGIWEPAIAEEDMF